jgi:hypothetical protein
VGTASARQAALAAGLWYKSNRYGMLCYDITNQVIIFTDAFLDTTLNTKGTISWYLKTIQYTKYTIKQQDAVTYVLLVLMQGTNNVVFINSNHHPYVIS